MQSLFNSQLSNGQGIIKSPDWPYIKAGINKQVNKVVTYSRASNTAVISNHFLVRLLQSISVPMGIDLERYYVNVDAMCLNLSMALKMTSSIYKGHLFENVFYGKDSREILIATNTSFDYDRVNNNWENTRAVEVLRHDMSDLSLNIPNGKENWVEDGLAVIVINIPMLAVQYRAFRLAETYYHELTNDTPRSIMQFISCYVLPNMLPSHVDQAIINRFTNLLIGRPLGIGKHKLPFYITEYEQLLNKSQQFYIKSFERSNKDIFTIMETIPLVNKNNLREYSRLPATAPTMQINWALLLSRLPILSLILELSKDGLLKKSRTDINQLKRIIRNYRNNYLLESMLPVDLLIDANNLIEKLELMAET